MKHVLISGCSTGIGRACALRLARIGYHVFAGVRKESDAESLREADTTGNVEPVMLDVTDQQQLETLKQDLFDRLDDTGLDGLVNNAGVGRGGPLEFVDPDLVRSVFEVNVMGPLLLTQAFIPLLRKAKGRVVTIGSIAGKASPPINAPYSISKHGVEAFTDSLRAELEPQGMRVSVIEPGPIETPMLVGAKDKVEEALADLPEEGRRLYSDQIRKVERYFQAMETRALPPEAVAEVVEHALRSARPRTRYLVTMDAKIVAFMKWLLPDRLFDLLAASQMK